MVPDELVGLHPEEVIGDEGEHVHLMIQLRTVSQIPQIRLVEAVAPLSHVDGLEPRVDFRGFVPEEERVALYAGALAVVYAPFNEDLGSFAGAATALDRARAEIAAIPDDAAEAARVDIPFPGRPTAFTGADYMATCALPQFFFHHAIAYGLLRSRGVPIGKFDYLGEMRTL